MSDQPLVSIIIPVYNHASFVYAALKSLFQQTYSNLELIIIDDGSKDESAAKIRQVLPQLQQEFPGRKVSFFVQENQGAHATINRGLELATGDYLTILNSDDFFHPERIETLYHFIRKEKREWAFSRVCAINMQGEVADRRLTWWRWYEQALYDMAHAPQFDCSFLKTNFVVTTGNLFFSRRLYQQVGGFSSYLCSHDYDYVLRALAVGDPVFVDRELYYYRIHTDNTVLRVGHLIEPERLAIHHNYLETVLPNRTPYRDSLHFALFRIEWKIDQARLNTIGQQLSTLSNSLQIEESKQAVKPGFWNKLKSFLSFSKQPKMTLVTHDLSHTGAPMVVAEMAAALNERGWDVNVISIKEGPLRQRLEQKGIPVSILPAKLANWHLQPSRRKRITALLNLMRWGWWNTKRTTLINTSFTWSALFGLSTMLSWRKYIWYLHDPYAPEAIVTPGLPERLLVRAKKNKNLRLWFGSKSISEIWQRAGLFGDVVYWSGIKSQPNMHFFDFKPLKRLLAVGTVSPRKGTHYLVTAFFHALESGRIPVDTTLTIVGFESSSTSDSYIRAYCLDLHNQIIRSKYAANIQVVASVEPDALDEIYASADLFVHPSQCECLPLAVLKAMAKGLPIVCTYVNGCAEVLEHEVTAYLCPPRNVQELENAIVEAISDPEKMHAMAKKAKAHFEQHYALEKNLEHFFKHVDEPFEKSPSEKGSRTIPIFSEPL